MNYAEQVHAVIVQVLDAAAPVVVVVVVVVADTDAGAARDVAAAGGDVVQVVDTPFSEEGQYSTDWLNRPLISPSLLALEPRNHHWQGEGACVCVLVCASLGSGTVGVRVAGHPPLVPPLVEASLSDPASLTHSLTHSQCQCQ